MLIEIIVIVLFGVWALKKFLQPEQALLELGNRLPGPPYYPILGTVIRPPFNGEENLKLRESLIEKYGHVHRLWILGHLLIFLSDPRDCEVILRSTKLLDKSYVYNFLHPWLGTGLLTSTGEKWQTRRKAITPTFHFKILREFVEIFNRNGTILIDCLKKTCGQGPFDVHPYISLYALDVICETAMGTKMNAQVNSSSSYVKAVRKVCHLLATRTRLPWLHFDFIYKLFGMLSDERKYIKVLHDHTNKIIQSKKEDVKRDSMQENEDENGDEMFGTKKKTAFLELLLKIGGNTFQTDDDIREEVDTFMFEGHDTTTSAISFALCAIARHPNIQEKIYEELINILGEDKKEPDYDDLQEMKYLEMVIKESLRLFPSVPAVSRKITESVEIPSGYLIPAGSLVALNIYSMQRNENNYPNPLEFNPDNFLPDENLKRHPYAFIPFSAGPRNCIGQKFAMAEMKSALSKIILNFKLDVAMDSDVRPETLLVLQSNNGYNITLKLRD